MAKTLKQMLEVYKPKAADEQKFADKHVVAKHDDPNGNKDDVFQGTNVKKIDRKKERHGYEAGEDEKVYEEVQQVDEKLAANASAGDYVKDFQKSDAPQFKGKSKEKRRVMAIAAFLSNKKGMKEEVVVEEEGSTPKTPREKELAAKHGDKNKITFGDVLKARGVGMKKEEVEQIDELSKGTLGSYVKSAARDAVASRKLSADFEGEANRVRRPNMKKANTSLANKFKNTAMKRLKGITAAANRLTKEEVEHLEEGDVAHAQFQHYHNETAKMLKNIHGALGKHFDAVTDKKNYMNGQAHWGHVGTIKDIHRSLQDIHDRVLEQGEYAKPAKVMKEETEMDSEVDVTLLNLYVNLDEDNRASMMKMLDEGRKEELLEFASTLGDE